MPGKGICLPASVENSGRIRFIIVPKDSLSARMKAKQEDMNKLSERVSQSVLFA
jgi:hypothetical protein